MNKTFLIMTLVMVALTLLLVERLVHKKRLPMWLPLLFLLWSGVMAFLAFNTAT